jgi:hypothetical protein
MRYGPNYVLGVDFGIAQDYSAVALLEHDLGDAPIYDLRHAKRFRLGTPYSELIERIARRVLTPPLRGRTIIVADSTGVGRPIIDQLRQWLSGYVYAITITSGHSEGGSHQELTVPKRDLIHSTQLLLQLQRLRIAEHIDHRDSLIAELLSYRVKINESTGHDSYSAWRQRDHDDLVTALSLAAWGGENRRMRPLRASSPHRMRIPGV